MHRIVGKLSYSNVVATLALFIALGGTSYAAVKLKTGSVKARHIARNAVDSTKVKNGSLKLSDFQKKSAPVGKPGPIGPAGPTGPQGAHGASGLNGAGVVRLGTLSVPSPYTTQRADNVAPFGYWWPVPGAALTVNIPSGQIGLATGSFTFQVPAACSPYPDDGVVVGIAYTGRDENPSTDVYGTYAFKAADAGKTVTRNINNAQALPAGQWTVQLIAYDECTSGDHFQLIAADVPVLSLGS